MKELLPLLMMTAVICNQTYGHHVYPDQHNTLLTLDVPAIPWLKTKFQQWVAYQSEHPAPVPGDQPDIFTQSLIAGDPMLNLNSIRQISAEVKTIKSDSSHSVTNDTAQ